MATFGVTIQICIMCTCVYTMISLVFYTSSFKLNLIQTFISQLPVRTTHYKKLMNVKYKF